MGHVGMLPCGHHSGWHRRRGEEHGILDEVGQGAQDEGHEEVHVDVVAGAVEPPGEKETQGHRWQSWRAQLSTPTPYPMHQGNPGTGRDISMNLRMRAQAPVASLLYFMLQLKKKINKS